MRPNALIIAALAQCFAIRDKALRQCIDMKTRLPEKGQLCMPVRSAEHRKTEIVQSSLKGNLIARKVRGTRRTLLLPSHCQNYEYFTEMS